MYYISTSQLDSERFKMSANYARVSKSQQRQSYIRNASTKKGRAKRLGRDFKKSARTKEEFFETAMIDSTTWWKQEDYQVKEVDVKCYPGLPAKEWEPPKYRIMDVSHGPRAISLNHSLLIRRWRNNIDDAGESKTRKMARLICKVAR